jgi:TPR repeat protein
MGNKSENSHLSCEKLREAESLFIKSNFDEAKVIFQELAESGNPRAMFFLGEYHRTDAISGTVDTETAWAYHKTGHELGDILCTYGFARMLLDENEQQGMELLRGIFSELLNLTRNGDVIMQNIVGTCYQYGYGVPKNGETAFEYYEKAANTNSSYGYAWAENNVALCFLHGIGVVQDVGLAELNTLFAADQEFIPAMFNMGAFAEKLGDLTEAKTWYKKAADKGYALAIAQLKKLGG